jgi:hypothetical protein
MLNWPADRLKILSIGTINDVKAPPRWKGKLPMAPSVTRLFMAGQSHSALGTAKIITGDLHDRKAIWRIDQTAPEGRYSLDNASRIAEMKDRAVTEAREQLPELRRHFSTSPRRRSFRFTGCDIRVELEAIMPKNILIGRRRTDCDFKSLGPPTVPALGRKFA